MFYKCAESVKQIGCVPSYCSYCIIDEKVELCSGSGTPDHINVVRKSIDGLVAP